MTDMHPTKREQGLAEEALCSCFVSDADYWENGVAHYPDCLYLFAMNKDELVRDRVAQALASYRTTLQTEMLECVPEKTMISCECYGDCACVSTVAGFNAARQSLLNHIEKQV